MRERRVQARSSTHARLETIFEDGQEQEQKQEQGQGRGGCWWGAGSSLGFE